MVLSSIDTATAVCAPAELAWAGSCTWASLSLGYLDYLLFNLILTEGQALAHDFLFQVLSRCDHLGTRLYRLTEWRRCCIPPKSQLHTWRLRNALLERAWDKVREFGCRAKWLWTVLHTCHLWLKVEGGRCWNSGSSLTSEVSSKRWGVLHYVLVFSLKIFKFLTDRVEVRLQVW